MQMVDWDEKFNLGIASIDQHHQHLVDLLNRAYNVILYEHDTQEILSIARELIDYTDYHFKAEEDLMEKFSYNQTAAHVAEHETFKTRLKILGKTVDAEVIYFLEEWLLKHISVSDKTLSVALKNKGYQEA